MTTRKTPQYDDDFTTSPAPPTEAITIWRMLPVGSVEVSATGTMPFEMAALRQMTEVLGAQFNKAGDMVHDRLEVTHQGRTVVVALNDGAEGLR